MSLRWTKIIGIAIWLGVMVGVGLFPAAAQTLPDLTQVVTDPSGAVTLFYPSDWVMEADLEGATTLSEKGEVAGNGQIMIHLEVISASPVVFEELPDWLVDEEIMPDSAFFSTEVYNGQAVWLAQGDNLYQAGLYSALVLVTVNPDEWVVIRADFPSERLSRDAALMTAILNSMVVLPFQTSNAAQTLRVRLPAGWIFTDDGDGFWLSPTQEDWQSIFEGRIPAEIGIRLKYRLGQITLEDLRQPAPAVLADSRTMQVNGVPTTLDLREDFTTNSTEMLLLRQRAGDAFLELWAVGDEAETLLAYLPTLQAIFASFDVQSPR